VLFLTIKGLNTVNGTPPLMHHSSWWSSSSNAPSFLNLFWWYLDALYLFFMEFHGLLGQNLRH